MGNRILTGAEFYAARKLGSKPSNIFKKPDNGPACGSNAGISAGGGGAVETAAPQRVSVQGRPFNTSGPLKLIPKSKPSKVSSNPSGLLIVALVVAIFWVGFLAGWLARGA